MRLLHLIIFQFLLLHVYGQNINYQYHNVILHIQNDPEIRNLVSKAFQARIQEQPAPIAYSVADSLTFTNISFALKRQFDPVYGIDSIAFNSAQAFKRLYNFKNIIFFEHSSKPPAEYLPLNIFLSKRIGNCIIAEISEDDEYPASQIIRFGTSVIIILLVDENGAIKENLYLALVNNN